MANDGQPPPAHGIHIPLQAWPGNALTMIPMILYNGGEVHMPVTPSQTMIDALLQAARTARDQAHAPYSDFRVGAALYCADGHIYSGCNVENASYGLTVCAERHAVAAMVAGGGRRIEALLVISPTPSPITPCGACRQVIAEFAAADMPILMAADPEVIHTMTLGELLPAGFRLTDTR
jgi:cytidine deaminase